MLYNMSMASLEILYLHRSEEEVTKLLARARELVKEKQQINWHDVQTALVIGAEEAYAIVDWLVDNHEAQPHISAHWIRCGRTYVLNNPLPNLIDMTKMLKIGEGRTFSIMQILEKKNVIRIKHGFGFEVQGRMSSFADLVRQMKRVAKKYRGRCEPELLVRTMFVDPVTALRLSQYGEESLGLRWKNRPKELL
jgi:hypothetical protein